MIGIYKITNKVNNKVYIGQSSDIKRRWRDHRSAAFNPKDNGYNYPLYKAIRKYGLDNFSFDILEECSQSDINEREIFYIKEYNAHGSGGYNQDDGGLHAVHGKLDKNTVLEIHELLKQRTMTMTEIAQQYQVHKNTIKMINNGGAWIMENITYPIRTKAVSLSESRAMKNNPNGYVPTKDKKYFCCNCGAPLLSKKATLCPTCDKIRQRKVPTRPAPLELAQMIVNTSFTSVGRHFGVSGKTIEKWCKAYKIPHKKKELKAWYNEQMGIQVVQPPKGPVYEATPVKQIDIKTNIVLQTFTSASAAAKQCGAGDTTNITRVCKGLRSTAYGYRWEYA